MSKSLQLALACAVLLFAGSASAFHLDDHSRIALQAYNEFAQCYPALRERLDAKALVDADLEEDLDVLTKWLHYSHFYHPGKDLRMWRAGSSERIADLEPDLRLCRGSATEWTASETADLGHVVHHLQDMAVPAHVVPVMHAAWDGFETYTFSGDISSEWACADMRGDADLVTLLKLSAEETLQAVREFRAYGTDVQSRSPREVDGAEFWREAEGDGFGEYGDVGNSFGARAVTVEGVDYEMSDASYRAFKQQQMKRAVRATLRALAWAFPQPAS